ncbi:MAG: hypothetical protein LAP21_15215 [Acidobacteriia bacterium]|nr:hypothetical protein [Terriglobia bacterium]
MPFVVTKFGLPTVTRADGTLGAYVQYNSNPRGDRFIWPEERLKILAAAQAAAAAKKRGQTLGIDPSSVSFMVNDAATTLQNRGIIQPTTPVTAPAKPAGGQSFLSSVPTWAWWTGGITVAAAIVLALSKRSGQRIGRQIPGARVYESL